MRRFTLRRCLNAVDKTTDGRDVMVSAVLPRPGRRLTQRGLCVPVFLDNLKNEAVNQS